MLDTDTLGHIGHPKIDFIFDTFELALLTRINTHVLGAETETESNFFSFFNFIKGLSVYFFITVFLFLYLASVTALLYF